MAAFKRNQKQLSERLKGNLDYLQKPHPWRSLRFVVSSLTLVAGIAAIPAYYFLHAPESFVNPGPISRAHAPFAQNCSSCHNQTQLIRSDSHQAGKILETEYWVNIDKKCGDCHTYFSFHAPNVVKDPTRPVGTGAQSENSSCTACHREHATSDKMLPTESKNCSACHNRNDLMQISSKDGLNRSLNEFPRKPANGLLYFPKYRPREGYSKAFPAFDQGHPGFQIQTAKLKDPDTLQYNHQRHEGQDIPKTEKGKKLECNYCHKTDATGTNFQKITFEVSCKYCHELALDPNISTGTDTNTAGLSIPHGDPEKVRSFLRTLGNQYVEYFIRSQNMSSAQATQAATGALQKLAQSYGVGATDYAQLGPKLENKVFYSKEHSTAGISALKRRAEGGQDNTTYFPGCAFCHQVTAPVPNVTPTITKAVIFDRWLGDGEFNHAKHTQQSCEQCHNSVHTSRLTSDINIPTQQSCTECHNSKPNGVANSCMDCHHYHNDPRMKTINAVDTKPTTADAPAGGSGGSRAGSLRAMLFGSVGK